MGRALYLFACLLAVLGTACGKVQSSPALGSGELRWSTFPISLYADPLLIHDPIAADDLEEALSFWESLAGKQLFELKGAWNGPKPFTGEPANPDSVLVNGIFFYGPWPFEPEVAGRTIVFSEGAQIQASAVLLNPDTELCYSECTDEPDKTSRRKLIAHELGHLIGFNHSDDVGDVMYPAILPGGVLDDLKVDPELLRKLTN